MKLFVTGGAGHTGCNFLKSYLSDNSENHAVVLVREKTNLSFMPDGFGDRIRLVTGDIREVGTGEYMRGCDAVMHIAHQTLCPEVAGAAERVGVERVFFVTTTGVFSKFNDLSEGYRRIEEGIRASRLNWTILRPTMIFGSERDANMHKLLRYLDRHSVFPIFGSGRSLMQPVFAEDLAAGLLSALKQSAKTSLKEYNLAGQSPLTYNDIVRISAAELGRKARLVHVPYKLSIVLAQAAEAILHSRSPISTEQVRRLAEDKAFSSHSAKNDFGYNPGDFRDRIALEVLRLRSIGLLT